MTSPSTPGGFQRAPKPPGAPARSGATTTANGATTSRLNKRMAELGMAIVFLSLYSHHRITLLLLLLPENLLRLLR